MITILHRGGPPKWLQYYIGVVWQMITVYHESWAVTLEISWQELFSTTKNNRLLNTMLSQMLCKKRAWARLCLVLGYLTWRHDHTGLLAYAPPPPSPPTFCPCCILVFFLFFRGTLSNLFGIITSNESNEKTRWWVEGGGGVVRTWVYCFSHLK